jgi:hypothetical protein
MAELSGQQLLEAAPKVQTELVDVSQWIPEGQVRIRVMSAGAHDAYEKSLISVKVSGNKVTQEPNLDNQTAKLLVHCICDVEGRLHYATKDIEQVGKMNGDMLRHIHKAAVQLNGLNKSIEDIAKNSEPSPEGDSSTG